MTQMQFSASVEQALAFGANNAAGAAEKAAASLAAKLAKVQGLKTFPAVAQKVMQILADPDFKIMDVARAVRDDPALGAKVMRVANSAFYSRGRQVASFDQAIVRLGRGTVREVVAAVATMDLFSDTSGLGARVRDHCAATASVSQVLVKNLAPALGEGAFLAGLLHDIGKLLLMSSGERVYESIPAEDLGRPDRAHLYELDALGYDHAVLAGQILWHWQIPAPVPQVVAWHHQPSLAYRDPSVDVPVAFLRIADHLETALEGDAEDIAEFYDQFAEGEDCRFAGVTADDLRRLSEAFSAARNDALGLFA
jgi:HD-like signal output (HDOD) protein